MPLPIFYAALLLTGVNLLLRLAATGFQVFLSRLIGPAGVGLVQLVLSAESLATVAAMGGVRTACMYLTAEQLGQKKPDTAGHVLHICFRYSLIFSLTAAGVLSLMAPRIAAGWIGYPETRDALVLFSRFLPVICLNGVMTGFFTAAGRIGTLAAVEVAEQALSMAVSAGLLLQSPAPSPWTALPALILGTGLGSCFSLFCLVLLRVRSREGPSRTFPAGRKLLRTALPLALGDDLKAAITTGETLMVPGRLSLHPGTAAPLAAFGTVCGMVFPVIMFPAAILFSLNELLIPELARCRAAGHQKRIRYLTGKSLRAAFLWGLLTAGLIHLEADPLCRSLFGTADPVPFLRKFSLLIPMLYCDAVTDAMTKGLGQQTVCVRYNILTAAIDLALLWVFLPKFGMNGYFYSFLLSHLLNFYLSLKRLLKITGRKFCPALPGAACLLMVAAISLCRLAPTGQGVCYMLILGSGLFLLKLLRLSDLSWILGLLKRKSLTVS